MACLRGISKRVNLLQRRVYPTFGHRFGDDKDETKPVSSPNPSTMINKFFPHIGTERLGSVFLESQYQSFVRPVGFGLSSYRFMSSTPAEVPDKVDSIDLVVGTEVVPDDILESVTSQVAPAIHEVAIAAIHEVATAIVDSIVNNGWAGIASISLILTGLTITMHILATKDFHKIDILRPQLEQLRQEISIRVSDPEAMAKEVEKQKKILYKKHGVNELAYLMFRLYGVLHLSYGLLVPFIITPSFKTGGILWFPDLTTPDSLYILPLLNALSVWILWKSFPKRDSGVLRDAIKRGKLSFAITIPMSLYLPSIRLLVLLGGFFLC